MAILILLILCLLVPFFAIVGLSAQLGMKVATSVALGYIMLALVSLYSMFTDPPIIQHTANIVIFLITSLSTLSGWLFCYVRAKRKRRER